MKLGGLAPMLYQAAIGQGLPAQDTDRSTIQISCSKSVTLMTTCVLCVLGDDVRADEIVVNTLNAFVSTPADTRKSALILASPTSSRVSAVPFNCLTQSTNCASSCLLRAAQRIVIPARQPVGGDPTMPKIVSYVLTQSRT